MIKPKWVERRVGRKYDLTLRRSFLFYVPKRTAYGFILIGFALAFLADIWAPPNVWMGPVYLFLVSFAAWTVSGLLAVGLGLLVIAFNWVARGMSFYPFGPELALANVAIRFLCVLMVVAFLVIARRSSEREWKLARLDQLTGGLNRPAFFETIEASNYENDWCALAYGDLDGLKCLNDERGHEEGDKAIKAFAETVRKSIRRGDVFARLGGDEFVVFMKVSGPESGQLIADRLNEETNAGNPKGNGSLPCSWGVLLLPPGPRQIDKELKAADVLMYRAKKSQTGLSAGIYCLDDRQVMVVKNNFCQDHKVVLCTSACSSV